ncbi:hypothetical protein, partial [Kitasatospora sp. NPDC047058]|uniref:hypothetical protein n=1 Tax=Kitasatospora sp. NPDC047058 TaxID=3155620 RepID=UPI0033D6B7DF
YGITTVVEPQNSLDDLALYERAIAEGRLRSRLPTAPATSAPPPSTPCTAPSAVSRSRRPRR